MYSIWRLQSTVHLKPWGISTCATLQAEETVLPRSGYQFSTPATQITSSKIERSIGFDWFFLFSVSSISFDCQTQLNSIHELSSISFDFKSSIEIQFDWVRFAMPGITRREKIGINWICSCSNQLSPIFPCTFSHQQLPRQQYMIVWL